MADDRGTLPPAMLASDAERQRTILVLRDAVVEGRLTLDEYSDRWALPSAPGPRRIWRR